MAYIDKTYYDSEYKGTPISDEDEFNKTAERASDVIDQLTSYTIANYDFERLATFLQTQVKKATAAQVEYFLLNGGYEATQQSELTSVNIGAFSYQEGNNQITNDTVIGHLTPTGLLYRGLGVYNGR
jgi:hypothetical protein